MDCPRCDYHSPFEQVRCPRCFAVFETVTLEELGHLTYLRDRLKTWRASGEIAPDTVAPALTATEERISGLELRLGRRPPVTTAPPEPSPSARVATAPPPPVQPATPTPPPPPSPPIRPITPTPPPPPATPTVQAIPQRTVTSAVQARRGVPAATRPAVTPPPVPTPAAPPRPAFSWGEVGRYLLSERTLNGFLALGAFLILASGTVISTINPTNLGPLPHFASTLITTLLFYLAGLLVRQKLALPRTGAGLLAIGAAFIPLTIWTLGQELLQWDPAAIWLTATLVCLPVYLGSHLLLRDRTFALLTALAGGGEVVTLLEWLQVPREWQCCALLVLALGYLTASDPLAERWPTLSWSLARTAQIATPLLLIATLIGRLVPAAWAVATGATPGFLFGTAVAVAWWLGVAYYARYARRSTGRAYPFVVAWGLPSALVLTLTETPLAHSWYSPALALLALAALAWGHHWQRALRDQPQPALLTIVSQPAYQLALALPLAAAWPWQSATSRIATLSIAALIAILATLRFRHPALHYAGAYLPALATGLAIHELGVRGVPGFTAAWQNLSISAIALVALLAGRFVLGVGRQRATTYTTLLAEPTYQVALYATAIAGLWPAQTLASRVASLVALVGLYALAAWLFRRMVPRAIAAYLLPVACGFGLQLAGRIPALNPLADWRGLTWAILAGCYFIFAWRFFHPERDGNTGYLAVAREPIWHTILPLSVIALGGYALAAADRLATTLLLAVIYGSATFLLRQRAWAWIAVGLTPLAFVPLLDLLGTTPDVLPLAWAGLAVALLSAAEIAVRRTGEADWLHLDTLTDLRSWRSRFAAPLFTTGYTIGGLALLLALARSGNAPLVNTLGVRYLATPIIAAFAVLIAALVVSTVTRRTSLFLYPASLLVLPPYTAVAALLARDWGLTLGNAGVTRLLALLGAGYLVAALATERAGTRFAAPFWLTGYALAAWMPILSIPDRLATVQTFGLLLILLALSAWLVHRDRHPAFSLLLRVLAANTHRPEHQLVRSLFLFLTTWLFPIWVLLTVSLWAPEPALYGLVLAMLAPPYLLLGAYSGTIRPVYRWPWQSAGYTLAALGSIWALPSPTLRIVALAISIGLWIGSALATRRATWLWPVALFTPILVWEIAAWGALPWRFAGLILVILSLTYSAVGMALHRGWQQPFGPQRGRLSQLAWPFFSVGQVLAILGLTLSAFQERPLLLAGVALGALGYGILAWSFRLAVYGWPTILTATCAYSVGLTLTPLPERFWGLGLLPLLIVALFLADLLRHRLDDAVTANSMQLWVVRILSAWATPGYTLAYSGTLAVLALSRSDTGIQAYAWWGVATIYALSTALFRQPMPLYPAIGAALAAYIVTVHTLAPELATSRLLALLIIPAAVLFAVADALGEQEQVDGHAATPRLWPLLGAETLLNSAWATPPLAYACGALLIATLGSAGDARDGLVAALAGMLLLGVIASRWRGEVEAWGALALGTLAFEQFLRVVHTPVSTQAPRWALIALALTFVTIGARTLTVNALGPWRRPLGLGAIGLAAWAVLLAFTYGALPVGRQPLAFTLALTGLTLVAHGFDQRERRLGYAGVASLVTGYLCQLLIFEIGQPQAFVLPGGIYLLTIAYIEWRRGTGAGIKAALEVTAAGLLLTVSAIQALGFLGAGVDRHLYGSVMVLQGVVLLGLGASLHWRRTFFAGALGLVVAVGILLIDPVREMNTWYLVAIVGFTMIALVVVIEQRRQQIPLWLGAWRARLEAWD